jgi:hypothetical protein
MASTDPRNKPWPHNPGVIARVEVNSWTKPGTPLFTECSFYYEATIYGQTAEFATYEAAVQWCIDEKLIREAQPERPLYHHLRDAFRPATIAEELS